LVTVAFEDHTTKACSSARRRSATARANRLIDRLVGRARALRAAQAPLGHVDAAPAAKNEVNILQTGESARFTHGCAPVGPSGCGGGAALDQVNQVNSAAVESMNKKSIAPRGPVLYPPQVALADIAKAKWNSAVAVIWRSTVPNLHAL